MAQLTSRNLVKQLSNIAEMDTRFDTIIANLIDTASDQVEEITERTFTAGVKTEFHTSYDQRFTDPDSQYLWVRSPPIDLGQTETLVWAFRNDHDINGITLTRDVDYTIPDTLDHLVIDRLRSIDTAFLPVGRTQILSYAERGFKYTYTGGFALTGGASSDPADEPNLVTVPSGLQMVIAQKIAADILRLKAARRLQMRFGADRHDLKDFAEILLPWTDPQIKALQPYRIKNTIF